MPNVTAALLNISGALCKSSVIPFLVSRRKLWLAPLLEWHAVTLPIWENARLGYSEFGKIPLEGRSPQKCIYSIPAQEMVKHRVKFG